MQNSRLKVEHFRLIFWAVPAALALPTAAQEPRVTERFAEYKSGAETDSLQAMVELKNVVPTAVYDLRYATKNNFMRRRLYPKTKQTFLRLAAAKALQKAAAELADSGYTLKVWDAYRPYAVTKKMWELVGDERYVANPAKGSGHNRGLAVDLTLMKDGKEVEMGTGFDNFSDTAHHAFKNLPAAVLHNRSLLRSVMERHGFKGLETEWWHYAFPNDGRYGVLDLPFRKLVH